MRNKAMVDSPKESAFFPGLLYALGMDAFKRNQGFVQARMGR